MTFEVVADFACETGECPIWHPLHQKLYWVDIPAGKMFSYDPASGHSKCVYSGEVIGGLVLNEDGGLVQCLSEGRVQIWRDGDIEAFVEGIPTEIGNRFNDAIADPDGRVLAGTMADRQGVARLYRIHTDGLVGLLLEEVGQSNGMGFSPDNQVLYHTDTHAGTITPYNYDSMEIYRLPIKAQKPDGLAVDAGGAIWSAQWGGSCILRYSALGELTERFDLRTPYVSSLAFGGRGYQDLFVTTAGGHDRHKNGPYAGALFHCRTEHAGQPPLLARLPRRVLD